MKSLDESEISKILSALRLPGAHEDSVLKLLKKFKEALHPNGKFHNSDLLIPITIYYYFKNNSIDEGQLIESSKITEREFRVFTIQIDRYRKGYLGPISRLANTNDKEEVKKIKEFLEFFAFCPVCNRKNEDYNLLLFYYSEIFWIQGLKEQLFWLIHEAKQDRIRLHNDISIGVPCCECFDTYFVINDSSEDV